MIETLLFSFVGLIQRWPCWSAGEINVQVVNVCCRVFVDSALPLEIVMTVGYLFLEVVSF